MLAGPILAIAVVVSLLVNIVQVLTSLQDMTISTVPRLLATAAALFFLMPWMWRQLVPVHAAACFPTFTCTCVTTMELLWYDR